MAFLSKELCTVCKWCLDVFEDGFSYFFSTLVSCRPAEWGHIGWSLEPLTEFTLYLNANSSTWEWLKHAGPGLHLSVNAGSVERGPRRGGVGAPRTARGTSRSGTGDTCPWSEPPPPRWTQTRVTGVRGKKPHGGWNNGEASGGGGSLLGGRRLETLQKGRACSTRARATSQHPAVGNYLVLKKEHYASVFKRQTGTNLNAHRLLSKDQGFLHHCSATGAPDREWKPRASPPICHRDTEEHLDGWEELTNRKQTLRRKKKWQEWQSSPVYSYLAQEISTVDSSWTPNTSPSQQRKRPNNAALKNRTKN